MKLSEIMALAKKYLQETKFDDSDIIRYITDVDLYVALNIMGKQEFKGYTLDDTEKEVLIPQPYVEAYAYYIQAKEAYLLHEFDFYNSAMALYNDLIAKYGQYYSSTHTTPEIRFHY